MYATKKFHPKAVESYLSKDDPYDKPKQTDKRFKGLQFQTRPLLKGQYGCYFGEYNFQMDGYEDETSYLKSQPRDSRKLGFGSLDAHRRDEFSRHIRAQQWRDVLVREAKLQRLQTRTAPTAPTLELMQFEPNPQQPTSPAPQQRPQSALFQTQAPRSLYDIGRDESGITPICNKCPRETFYCPHRVGRGAETLRRVGTWKTTSQIVGGNLNPSVNKPTYGRKSLIKDFYDNNHLGSLISP